MDKLSLWSRLERDPMAGWLNPQPIPLPPLEESARLVWCGIGGSIRSAEALVEALGTMEERRRWVPLVAPGQEVPPLSPMDQLVFASKSGRTLELWAWISHLRALPIWGRWHRPPIAITLDDGNPLVRLAEAEGWDLLQLPPQVPGRFSAFTPVGMAPLAWMGRDVKAFLTGGRSVIEQARMDQGLWGRRIWQAVEKLVECHERGQRVWAFLPYAERLRGFGDWWVQLMAESLSKKAPDGRRTGFTPVSATGPHDQHAQLQRWMAGPRDVGVLMLTVGGDRQELMLRPPDLCPFEGLDRFTPSQILHAEAEGTHKALVEAGIPTMRWHLEAGLREADLGSLFMAWQLTVALTGLAFGINPFDQPAVELGKRWTESLLGAGASWGNSVQDAAKATSH